MQSNVYLRPSEVSALLQISERQLSRQRQARNGIPFIRLGHKLVRYNRSDVEAYMHGNKINTKLRSSS